MFDTVRNYIRDKTGKFDKDLKEYKQMLFDKFKAEAAANQEVQQENDDEADQKSSEI